MAFYIYDNELSLPLSAEIGDQAITRDEKNVYVFSNISTFVSYSHEFVDRGYLLADSLFSTFLDSNDKSLTIEFWTNTAPGDFPVFIAENAEEYYSAFNVVDNVELQNENIKNFTYSPTLSPTASSQYLDAPSYIKIDESQIDFADSSQQVKEFYPFTVDFWSRKNDNNNDKTIVSFIDQESRKSILRLDYDKIVVNDVDHTFASPVFQTNDWQHNVLTYDGFDYKFYKDGDPQTLTRDARYDFQPGTLSFAQVDAKKDAAFQCKVVFPSVQSEGVLFDLGDENYKTKIELINGGTQLKFSTGFEEELQIVTSNIPADDQEHVVSWDIQISPARIRLWIDGQNIAQNSLARPLTNLAWASGNFSSLDLVNSNVSYRKLSKVYSSFFVERLPGTGEYPGHNTLALSFDVRFDQPIREGALWTNYYSYRSNDSRYGFMYAGIVNSGGNLVFKVAVVGNRQTLSVQTSNIPTDGLVHTITWEIVTDPGALRLWIDGNLEGQASILSFIRWSYPYRYGAAQGEFGRGVSRSFPSSANPISKNDWPGEIVNDIRGYYNTTRTPVFSSSSNPEAGLTPDFSFPIRVPTQHYFEDDSSNLVVELNKKDSDGDLLHNINPITKSTYVWPWNYSGTNSGLLVDFDQKISPTGNNIYYFESELIEGETRLGYALVHSQLASTSLTDDQNRQHDQFLYYFPQSYLGNGTTSVFHRAYLHSSYMRPGERYSFMIDENTGNSYIFRNRDLIRARTGAAGFGSFENQKTKLIDAVLQDSDAYWRIGNGFDTVSLAHTYISDLKYSKKIEYTDNFTPPTTRLSSDDAVLLAARDTVFDDSSPSQRVLSDVGGVSLSSLSPYQDLSTKSISINNGYLSFYGDQEMMHDSSGMGFTIQAWVYLENYQYGTILSSSSSGNSYSASTDGFYFGLSAYPSRLEQSYSRAAYAVAGFYDKANAFTSRGPYRILASSKYAIPLKVWTHIAFVYDGQSESRMYINGVDQTYGNMGLWIGDEYPRAYSGNVSSQTYPDSPKVKFYFNPSDWALNPAELRAQLSTAVDGGFGQSKEETNQWPGAISSGLRYNENSTFSAVEDYSPIIGSSYIDLTNTETGTNFAQNYISSSGGSIVNHSGGGDLSSVISSMSEGDALVLSPGTYSIDPQLFYYTSGGRNTYEGIFLGKNILICGSTSDPNAVKILFGHQPSSLSSNMRPIFGVGNNSKAQIAFITIIKNRSGLSTYINPLCYANSGGYAYNVIFDFGGIPPIWSYNSPYVFFTTTFEKCVFKNYGGSNRNFASPIGLYGNEIVSIANVFEGLGGTNFIKDYSTYEKAFIDSSRAISNPYEGYISAFKLFDGVAYDSEFTPEYNDTLDSSPVALVSSTGTGGEVLSYKTNGTLVVNNSSLQVRSPHILNTWTHTAISIDSSGTLRVYEDGTLVTENLSIIDSNFDLIPTLLDIGRGVSLDVSNAQKRSYFYEGYIKDFRVNDNALVDASFELPTVDLELSESTGDILLTASQIPIPDTDLVRKSSTGDIQPNLTSPYTAEDFSWFKLGITSVSDNVFFDSSNSNNQLNRNRLIFSLDSYYSDSDRLPVSVTLRAIDDSSKPIEWQYEDFQNYFQIIEIGKDSHSIKYYLNPVNEGEYSFDRVAFIRFFADAADSDKKIFVYEGENQSLNSTLEIDIMYDGMSTVISNSNSVQGIKYVTLNHVDSTFDLSSIIFDSYDETQYISVVDSQGAL